MSCFLRRDGDMSLSLSLSDIGPSRNPSLNHMASLARVATATDMEARVARAVIIMEMMMDITMVARVAKEVTMAVVMEAREASRLADVTNLIQNLSHTGQSPSLNLTGLNLSLTGLNLNHTGQSPSLNLSLTGLNLNQNLNRAGTHLSLSLTGPTPILSHNLNQAGTHLSLNQAGMHLSHTTMVTLTMDITTAASLVRDPRAGMVGMAAMVGMVARAVRDPRVGTTM